MLTLSQEFFGYRFAKFRREEKRAGLAGKVQGPSRNPDSAKTSIENPELAEDCNYSISEYSGGDTQEQLNFERSNVAEQTCDTFQEVDPGNQVGSNLDGAEIGDQPGGTDQQAPPFQVPQGLSWEIPSHFLRGKVDTTWTNPGIEYEWSNGVPNGIPDVEPVTHDLNIGRYGTRAYEPRSYIPKSAIYRGYTELQLRYLIHKRDHLGVAVSFPTRDGIYRDALIKFLEDQDASKFSLPLFLISASST